jgi:succinate-semialdehyde dehydrogenase / glutarate-semialdehyde dehydrogenase
MSAIDIHNPATGETVGSVVIATSDDIVAAVTAARRAQKQWQERVFADRAAIVRRFHDLMLDGCDEILNTIQSETGKARRDALAEVVSVAGTARYYLGHGPTHLSDRRGAPAVPALTGAEVVYKPLGIVGLITPWNYPFLLSIGDALPALLAGNAVVVKPSELTPLSAVLAHRLLLDAGLDPGLFHVVHGPGEIGRELIRHVDYVGFTGGIATGRKVALAAAERLIPFSLELGGKNPMIVLEGASLDEASSGLIAGAFANTGQACIAVERAYVEDRVFDEFAQRARAKSEALKVGWSRDWDIDVGSLISESHAEKVMRHIDQAVQLGAKVVAGGQRRSDLGKTFVAPTILTGVPDAALACREETFGPVVSLYRVRDADEAITRANASEFGLNASIWTGNRVRSRALARRLETGSVAINSTLLIYNTFDVPMGGVKCSGIGRRHGEQGILRYTQAQSIVSSIESRGGYDALLPCVDRPSRARWILKGLRWWRKL